MSLDEDNKKKNWMRRNKSKRKTEGCQLSNYQDINRSAECFTVTVSSFVANITSAEINPSHVFVQLF